MGNYFSIGTIGQKRKLTESDLIEHDFDTDLARGSSTIDNNSSSESGSNQSNENLEDDNSRLTGILNRMNQTDVGTRNSDRLDPIRSVRNSDFESLLFNRSRIARATASRNNSNCTGQNPLYQTMVKQPRYSSNSPRTSMHSDSADSSSVDVRLSTPVRKKMKSTTDYIYTHFFLNGENSDITIDALGKEWKLHKIYLCQSPYFETMFKSGSQWKESSQSAIKIAMPDEKINERSLFITFGSFYREDIEILPTEVVNVLSCASLLSLDGLISKCAEIMIDNINYKSVIEYHEASLTYGVKVVTDSTLKWICSNIMSNTDFSLIDLKLPLFEEILSMNELLIIQVETDLYTLCKKWLYFQLNKPSGESTTPGILDKDWQKTCNNFFKNFLMDTDNIGCSSTNNSINLLDNIDINDSGNGDVSLVFDCSSTSFSQTSSCQTKVKCLLDRPAFQKYTNLFKKIRLQHILTDQASLHVLYNDRIIPNSWIEPHFYRNWLHTIYIDQEHLSHEFEIGKKEFDMHCARFGRALAEDIPATWRWVGFNYGIDLLISHTSRNLTLKRNVNQIQSPYKGLLSQKSTIRIFYVMKVVKLDAFGNETWSRTTELTSIDLNRNDEKFAIAIDQSVEYPVLLNFKVIMHPFYENNLANNLFS